MEVVAERAKIKTAIISFGVIVVIIITVGVFLMKNEHKLARTAKLIITETGESTSLDPLDGDGAQNQPVVRMIYATPIETNSDNELTSSILDSFSYSEKTKSISWKLKSNLKFSDGSTITSEDVAFAVSRMLFTRPNFPVIKFIKGTEEWLKTETPLKSLPSGIKIDGNQITIELTQDYPHPMYRFCLEPFSVIPKKCVDEKTNKIVCDVIPSSGYYEISDRKEREISFKKRNNGSLIQGKNYPDQIQFIYRSSQEAFGQNSEIDDNTVAFGNESRFPITQLKDVEKSFEVSYTPEAWFSLLQLNPDVKPFDDKNCRLVFAESFRQNYLKLSGIKRVESSVFTRLVTGYSPYEEMKSKLNLTTNEIESCISKLRVSPPQWGQIKATTPELFVETLKAVSKEFGFELPIPLDTANRKEEIENFLAKKTSLMNGWTGFWELDPSGDIQMLFTPNLHKPLIHMWSDPVLQTKLSKLVKDGKADVEAFKNVNDYIFNEGKFNVYTHIRRFYVSKNASFKSHYPVGITSPAPWQIFEEFN